MLFSPRQLSFAGAILLFIPGCDDLALPPAGQPSTMTSTSTTTSTSTDPVTPAELSQPASSPGDDSLVESSNAPDEGGEANRSQAVVGVGKKGRGYGGGVITEPVRQYFRIQERVAFDIKIPQALRHYQALDPNGRGPQSHEAFMAMLKEHEIELPELPPGEEYLFDPVQQELMVQRPADPSASGP
jgi:hypothetical protein